jgi:hypothetical protein
MKKFQPSQINCRKRTAVKYFINYFLIFSVLFIVATIHCSAQQNSAVALDGQHDFDFNIGVWKTHISMLDRPLTGSKTWKELRR